MFNKNLKSGIVRRIIVTPLLVEILIMFKSYGINKISMGDIAKNCKVSKKTIYKIYLNKNNLLQEVLNYKLQTFFKDLNNRSAHNPNAIDELNSFFEHLKEELTATTGLFYYDLGRYHSELYHYFMDIKNDLLLDFLLKNIERGQKEELYKLGEKRKIISSYCVGLDITNLSRSWSFDRNQNSEFADFLDFMNEMLLNNLVSLKGYSHINKLGI